MPKALEELLTEATKLLQSDKVSLLSVEVSPHASGLVSWHFTTLTAAIQSIVAKYHILDDTNDTSERNNELWHM